MTACHFDRDRGEYLLPDGEECRLCAELPSRLAANTDTAGPGGCWTWQAALSTEGYGVIHFHGRQHKAHRLSYEVHRGRIPEGLVIDHLCRNRACVNPDHLETVTGRVNILRGISPWAVNAQRTECVHGHPFTPENTRYDRGRRYCVECKRRSMRITARKRRAREKASR